MDVRESVEDLTRRLGYEYVLEHDNPGNLAAEIIRVAEELEHHAPPRKRVEVILYIQEVVLWHVVSRDMESALGYERIVRKSEKGQLSSVHPLVEPLAKARDRMRKVWKEALERFERVTETDEAGTADIVEDLMKKTERAFEDAVDWEPGLRTYERPGFGTGDDRAGHGDSEPQRVRRDVPADAGR